MVDEKNLQRLLSIIRLMADIEEELGLKNLPPVSRDIYYAVAELKKDGGTVRQIRSSQKLLKISRTSFFKHLQSLCEKGWLIKVERKSKHPRYVIA